MMRFRRSSEAKKGDKERREVEMTNATAFSFMRFFIVYAVVPLYWLEGG
jgi:hypothetical protein